MRFRLRTLLIILAIGPAVLAIPWLAWELYRDYRLKMVIDEINHAPVRPKEEPTAYENIGIWQSSTGRKPTSTDKSK